MGQLASLESFMNKDEIIEMAKQAGFGNYTFEALSMFEVFAKLVAQHEREACAKVAENTKAPFTAIAIQARGQV
jgi:hypothetical protein